MFSLSLREAGPLHGTCRAAGLFHLCLFHLSMPGFVGNCTSVEEGEAWPVLKTDKFFMWLVLLSLVSFSGETSIYAEVEAGISSSVPPIRRCRLRSVAIILKYPHGCHVDEPKKSSVEVMKISDFRLGSRGFHETGLWLGVFLDRDERRPGQNQAAARVASTVMSNNVVSAELVSGLVIHMSMKLGQWFLNPSIHSVDAPESWARTGRPCHVGGKNNKIHFAASLGLRPADSDSGIISRRSDSPMLKFESMPGSAARTYCYISATRRPTSEMISETA